MTRSGSEPENNPWPIAPSAMQKQGGGGYSTVGDLLKFADALMGHKLLNAEYTDLLIAGKVDAGNGAKYAYGFRRRA